MMGWSHNDFWPVGKQHSLTRHGTEQNTKGTTAKHSKEGTREPLEGPLTRALLMIPLLLSSKNLGSKSFEHMLL